MIQNRRLLFFSILFPALALAALWWTKPKQVDMASYVPADALVYIETNQPLEILAAVADTDAWRALEHHNAAADILPRRSFLQNFMRWTGIGPAQSVILARAQVAAVVTDLGAAEEGESIRIKQEQAILIETHTLEARIRTPVEQALKTLAEKTYERPSLKRTTIDGVEFAEWSAPDGTRQIIGVIVGSLVIVGNTERAVQSCLAASQGRKQSLQGDAELARLRVQLDSPEALAFGYVPAANSARLLAIGLPILIGRAPGDSEFQRVLTTGAAKIFGSLAWTAKPYQAGIEDRYLITLQPQVVSRLRQGFISNQSPPEIQRRIPIETYSLTSYQFADPSLAWQDLKGAVSSQTDTLSAIVFSTLMKSALVSYGIDDPDAFLGAVKGEVFTLRLDESGERSLLIAGVRDRSALRELITKKLGAGLKTSQLEQAEILENPEFGACFLGELMVMGDPAGVRLYVAEHQRNAQLSPEKLRQLTFFASRQGTANVVTYSNDLARVRSFMVSVNAARGGAPMSAAAVEQLVAGLPFAVTETTLGDRGIERVTRSPLGQFSTLVPLLLPAPQGHTTNGLN